MFILSGASIILDLAVPTKSTQSLCYEYFSNSFQPHTIFWWNWQSRYAIFYYISPHLNYRSFISACCDSSDCSFCPKTHYLNYPASLTPAAPSAWNKLLNKTFSKHHKHVMALCGKMNDLMPKTDKVSMLKSQFAKITQEKNKYN